MVRNVLKGMNRTCLSEHADSVKAWHTHASAMAKANCSPSGLHLASQIVTPGLENRFLSRPVYRRGITVLA